MKDPQYSPNQDGSVVFVEPRGDYIEKETKRAYKNIYVFKFVVLNRKFTHICEYANPVTWAKFAGLKIG